MIRQLDIKVLFEVTEHSFHSPSKLKVLPSVLEIAESKLPLFFLLTVPSLWQAFQGASDATRKDNCIMIMALRLIIYQHREQLVEFI